MKYIDWCHVLNLESGVVAERLLPSPENNCASIEEGKMDVVGKNNWFTLTQA